MDHVCYDCRQAIKPGLAVLRTMEFQRVAFHRECWSLRLLPAQRQPADNPVSRSDP